MSWPSNAMSWTAWRRRSCKKRSSSANRCLPSSMGGRTPGVVQGESKHTKRRPLHETSYYALGCVSLAAVIADATRFRLHAYRTNTRLTKSAVLADCQRRTAVAFCLESGEFLVGDFIKNELAVETIKQSAS